MPFKEEGCNADFSGADLREGTALVLLESPIPFERASFKVGLLYSVQGTPLSSLRQSS